MNDLVTLTSQRLDAEAYTTTEIIAKNIGIYRNSVKKTVWKHRKQLEHFGKLKLVVEPLQSGQTMTYYRLNERQTMRLFYYLNNTPKVEMVQEKFINQFYMMKRVLIERQAKYELGKEFNKSLATAVKDSRIDMHGHQYSTFHRLAYKMALGVDVTKLRKSRHIKAGEAITTYLSADEAQAVALINQRIKTLLDVGLNYQEIKQALQIKGVIYRIELQLPAKSSAIN